MYITNLENPEMQLMRQGWADALIELGSKDPDVVVLDADLSKSTLTSQFREKHPGQFFNVGISEQDMVNTAAGMSLLGKIPFITSYCVFLSGRAWDQIRNTVCYSNLNVKFGGAHAGISVGPDGATHQSLEDIATTRVLPNMTVLAPADYWQTKKAIEAAYKLKGPVFVRFGREKVPTVTSEDTLFEVGKANLVRDGKDLAIIACGPMLYQSMLAAAELEKEGISVRVLDLHTIKPLDKEAVLKAAKECGAIVTAEEHSVLGGMGSAVAEFLVQEHPVPMEMVGVQGTFGESGKPEELMEKYGMLAKDIVEKGRKVLKRK
ncbi:MAG: transketolase family protein [Candidatus Gracilibacteria bacterium]|nr:transketolase family protein [Candidatus Gracilibacteria bacterium]